VGYLQQQALENPPAFLALLGRVLPHTIAASVNDGRLEVYINKFGADGNLAAIPYDPADWKRGAS
jgi:hypothetical protein